MARFCALTAVTFETWITSLVFIVLSQIQCSYSSGVGWVYYNSSSGLDPNKWSQTYPDCAGRMQSPIEIQTKYVVYDPNLEYFDLSEYKKVDGVTLKLENHGGHTAEVVYGGTPIYISKGGLPDKYRLAQYHFHWGKVDSRGSEHGMDGKHFPMEMHLVHYQDHLDNITNAAPHPSGLAVIGFFFTIGKHNAKFDQLLNHFAQIKDAGQETTIPTFPLSDLLPTGNIDFFRYQGSLTTPPCYESVIWSIANEAIDISHEQVAIFRGLYDADHHHLVDDFRPAQSRNDRTVTTTHMSYDQSNHGHSVRSAMMATVPATLLSLLSRGHHVF